MHNDISIQNLLYSVIQTRWSLICLLGFLRYKNTPFIFKLLYK
jgi:hypothetical protein